MNTGKYISIIVMSLIWVTGALGCKSPIALDSLRGGIKVFPDLLNNHPAVLAFLSANDRRCDKEIPSLTALHYREESPVQVVGVLVFDDYEFVTQIKTLNKAAFLVLLDPERKLAEKFKIEQYPTYLYISPTGKEVDRVDDVRLARRWVDFSRWHEKAIEEARVNPRESDYRDGRYLNRN